MVTSANVPRGSLGITAKVLFLTEGDNDNNKNNYDDESQC